MLEQERNVLVDPDNFRRYYKIYDLSCKYSISPNGFVINTETGKEEPRLCNGYRIFYELDKRVYFADELVWKMFIGELMGPIKYIDNNSFNLNAYNLYTPLDIRKLSETEWLINDVYFKQIPGFSKYLISQHGTVYTKTKHMLVNRAINYADYPTVALVGDDGKRSPRKVHRLVYATYCGELDPTLEIDHIDFNRHNAYYTNLQQISKRENQDRIQMRQDHSAILFEGFGDFCDVIDESFTTDEILSNISIYPEDSDYSFFYNLVDKLKENKYYETALKNFEDSQAINQIQVGAKRLKPEDIPVIREMAADNVPVKEIAKKFGVSNVNIYDILNGKKWKDC